MASSRSFLTTFLVICCGAAFVGCTPDVPPPHRPPTPVDSRTSTTRPNDQPSPPKPTYELPKTYATGVRRVVELRDRLREGWRENRHDAVHEPLHELGPLLRELPRLLDVEDVPDDVRSRRIRAIHELYEMFALIDGKLHSGFGAEYEELAEKIDVRTAELSQE